MRLGAILTEAQPAPPKVRRLRVFNAVVEIFLYCLRHAGRLFVFAWFPCALVSATSAYLDWLIHAWPPRMPAWALSSHFDPATWLTPFATAPWEAMAFLFVLVAMSDPTSRRGIITTPAFPLSWLRFELGGPVLLAAAILAAIGLLGGLVNYVQLQSFVALYVARQPPDGVLALWSGAFGAIRVVVMAIVFASLYPFVVQALRTGALSFTRMRQIMRGNRLRLIAIFILLQIIAAAVDQIVAPASVWLANALTDTTRGVLLSLIARRVLDFPFLMLWIVVWVVTVATILDVLDKQPPERADAHPATR